MIKRVGNLFRGCGLFISGIEKRNPGALPELADLAARKGFAVFAHLAADEPAEEFVVKSFRPASQAR